MVSIRTWRKKFDVIVQETNIFMPGGLGWLLKNKQTQVNGKSVDTETTTSQFSKAMPENNLLEDIIPIDKKFKVC